MPFLGAPKSRPLFEENHVMAFHPEAKTHLVADGARYTRIAESSEMAFDLCQLEFGECHMEMSV